MLDFLFDLIGAFITDHGVRAFICVAGGGAVTWWLSEQEKLMASTAQTLAVIGLVCGVVALLSILAYCVQEKSGLGWGRIIALLLCLVMLVSCGGVYEEVNDLSQPLPAQSGYLSFTGRLNCRFCAAGKCNQCKSGIYDHGKYLSSCIVCHGDGICDKCGGDGWQ